MFEIRVKRSKQNLKYLHFGRVETYLYSKGPSLEAEQFKGGIPGECVTEQSRRMIIESETWTGEIQKLETGCLRQRQDQWHHVRRSGCAGSP